MRSLIICAVFDLQYSFIAQPVDDFVASDTGTQPNDPSARPPEGSNKADTLRHIVLAGFKKIFRRNSLP